MTPLERKIISIPVELLEQFERGSVLLFVGERITHDAQGLAVPDRLISSLAARISNNAGVFSFPELAQAYEDETSRQSLVQFMIDALKDFGDDAHPVHQIIAELPQCHTIVTTALNRRLENAFRQANRPLQVFVRGEDTVFEDPNAAQLYKLRGSLEQPASLILTEDDHEKFFEDQQSISIVLQGHLVQKTILFIGYDLDDPHFQRLYRKVVASLHMFARKPYAFGETPSPRVARWCKRNNIDVVHVNTTTFLELLKNQLAERAQHRHPPKPPERPKAAPQLTQILPYKLLDAYEAADSERYFGRENEIKGLEARIRAHRLTLLYGASGVGKTSLLHAGVLPHLEAQEPTFVAVYVRLLGDPVQAIRRSIRMRFPDVVLPEHANLVEVLAATTTALQQPLIIVLDQFEEFFIRFSAEQRAIFAKDLAALFETPVVPVKFVLSLREDWLAAISELQQYLPAVYYNQVRLLPLSREQAQQAIVSPVELLGQNYEQGLLTQLLDDLSSTEQLILPPQLQLVCSKLYEALQPGERTITMASYVKLGGVRGILQDYLETILRNLTGDDRVLAGDILGELVTSQGTRAAKTVTELTRVLSAEQGKIEQLLYTLKSARLLRVPEGETNSYELAHEYLIRDIALVPEARARKQIEEILRQGCDNWNKVGVLLSENLLALIAVQINHLRPSIEEADLLKRSVDHQIKHARREQIWLNVVAGIVGGGIGGLIGALLYPSIAAIDLGGDYLPIVQPQMALGMLTGASIGIVTGIGRWLDGHRIVVPVVLAALLGALYGSLEWSIHPLSEGLFFGGVALCGLGISYPVRPVRLALRVAAGAVLGSVVSLVENQFSPAEPLPSMLGYLALRICLAIALVIGIGIIADMYRARTRPLFEIVNKIKGAKPG